MQIHKKVTAAMVAIGDELLSGRTKDKNIAHLAGFLTVKGIELKEVRIVSDDEDAIVTAVNALRKTHDYLFTSGGIGPTHDDITTQSIAKAFGADVISHKEAFSLLDAHYKNREMEFTPARQKMAETPDGAELVENKVSVAPGYRMDNVYVMAGVPSVFNAMLLAIEPELEGGQVLLSVSVDCPHGEGTIGGPLTDIAKAHQEVSIGSYPRFDGENYSTQIVIRSPSQSAINEAEAAIIAMLEELENS